jgi:hypothetical protein
MATTDREQRRRAQAALAKLREVMAVLADDIAHEEEELQAPTHKAYTAAQRRTLKRAKQDRYGHEVFAVPALASYPLTTHRRPDRARVQAAWDYIHVAKNREKLGDTEAAKATARIRAFARRHFPDMVLEEPTTKSLALDEVYVFPANGLWPLTDHCQPSAERVQKAWQDVHSALWEARLSDRDMARAETRISLFAAQHGVPLTRSRRPRSVLL